MIDLIRLLLSRSYWRTILRPHTWATAFLNLRRFHKDKRSRKQLGQFLVLISIPAIVLFYVAWLTRSGGIFLLLPALALVGWFQNRRAKEERQPLSIMPETKPAIRTLSAQEKAEIRRSLADMALFYAVLLNRAGSESFLKTKVVPEGMEVVSRRLHLDLLRDRNIWERLATVDREAFLAADGHWEGWQIHAAMLAGERVRLLRWALRLDGFLPMVGQQLKIDHKGAKAVIEAPDTLYKGTDLVTPEGVETGYRAAEEYFFRCYAEGLVRGYYAPQDEDERKWAADICAQMGGRQHEDLLLDTQLVSEASEETVRWAAEMAHQRRIFLAWLARVLDGQHQIGTEIPAFMPVRREEQETETATAAQ